MGHSESKRTGRRLKLLLGGVALLVVVAFLQAGLRHGVASANRITRGATQVAIDVNPGGAKAIDLASASYIPVAVLGAAGFDVALIEPSSLSFAGSAITKTGGSTRSGIKSEKKQRAGASRFEIAIRDVNKDGRLDLVTSFPVAFFRDLSAGTRTAVLKGRLLDGSQIEGAQTVQVTGVSPIRSGSPNTPAGAGFCNATSIVFPADPPGSGDATPFPSNITVAALTGVVTDVTVTLNGVSHTFPDDLEILLVAPNGQAMVLDNGAFDGTDAITQNLTFSDSAANYAPEDAPLVTGTYKPASYFAQTSFGAPAPPLTTAAPYAATFKAFNGIDPNGTWSLYARDVEDADTGSISGGWCIDITTGSSGGCLNQLFQGTLTTGDTTQTGALVRSDVAGLCDAPKPCPALADPSGSRFYDAYTITNNSGASVCVTATVTGDCSGEVSLVAYQPSFNPASLCTNYLNDAGTVLPTLPATSQTQTMAFGLMAGQSVVLVVHEITPAAGCTNYGLLVEGNLCSPCAITCPANVTQSNDPNQCGAVVNYPAPVASGSCGIVTCVPASGSFFPVGTTTVACAAAGAAPGCAVQTITHSSSQAITPLNSVSCNDGFGHTNDSYWRAFTLSTFGISGPFGVLSVDIGIENATSGGAAGAARASKSLKRSVGGASGTSRVAGAGQSITVNLYTSSMAFPTGFPGSLTLIGTVTTTIADQSGTILNVPVTGTAAAGSELIVEVFTPDGTAAGNLIFIGSNSAGETGPSYLSAADCGITVPTELSAIGFPEMQIVINVNGCQQLGGAPTCAFIVTVNDTQPPSITCPPSSTVMGGTGGTVVTYPPPTSSDNCPGVTTTCTPPSGSTLSAGSTTISCTATDGSGNTASCGFTIAVFDVCLQDTSNPTRVLLFNSVSGEYRFCCNGTVFTGTGKVTRKGEIITLEHITATRRVNGKATGGGKGTGSLQMPPGTTICTISDATAGSGTCACP